jgi:CheY-like chemotaxis protein
MANILLIEDDQALRELFSEVLEACGGHSVVAAANGDEGIARFNDSIDLVVTDMNMPHKSGLQTAAELRKRAPHVPIIAMSGHPGQSQELTQFAMERGANQFLSKPFTPEVLCKAVAQLLAAMEPTEPASDGPLRTPGSSVLVN